MTAPSDFNPHPLPVSTRPVPAPPTLLKPQLYSSPEHFAEVDKHALQVAQREHATFRDLIWDLVSSQKFPPLQAVRSVFRWMTSKNMYSMKFTNGESAGSPESILCGFKNKKATYARIFETICSWSGLHCVIITGHAKGVEYRVAMPFANQPANHSWNAVYLNGGWQLVDCHWATRYLNASERNVPENLVYEYDDFYFLPQPKHLGYTHFPDDPNWQLVSQPLQLNAFEQLPLTKSVFFKLGMSFTSHGSGVIHTDSGVVAISLGSSSALSFTYKLLYGNALQGELNGVKLSRYVLQSTTDRGVTYYFRAPAKGSYAFTVYVQAVREELSVENLFTAAVEYQVIADRAADNTTPYPLCSDTNWGPGAPVQQLGLRPVHAQGVMFADDFNRATVSMELTRPLRFYCKLQKNDAPEGALAKHIEQRVNENRVDFVAELPSEGEYGLEIYANDPSSDGNTFTHICQYLLVRKPAAGPSQEAYYPAQQVTQGMANVSLYGERPGPATAPKPASRSTVSRHTDDLPPPPPELQSRSNHASRVPGSNDEFPPPPPDLYADSVNVQVKAIGEQKADKPSNFQPVAVTSNKSKEAPKPAPLPPSQREVYNLNDPAVFKSVDKHAQEISRLDHPTFKDLLWDLLHARDVGGDLEKARILFQWLCSKDLSQMHFQNVARDSPEELLMNLRDGKVTYAQVYELLCNYAGLHCVTLPGYAKGADYRPGYHFSGAQGMHAWNAVCINGHWRLVDCHWAARRMVGQRENVTYELDEYYFLPNPHQFIFSHLPEQPDYQLLERTLTQMEFESLPVVKSQFFKFGLYFASHHAAQISCDGEVVVRIGFPPHKHIGFSFTLTHEDGRDEIRGTKLSKFGMYEQCEGVARFRIRPPERGNFRFIIYAKEDTAQSKEGVYGAVCEYKVNQAQSGLPAFPPCQSPCWGPSDVGDKLGLIVSNRTAEIKTSYGQAEITFQLSNELRFLAKLKSQHMSEDSLESHVLHRMVSNLAVFSVSLPARGEYGLEIYVNDPAKDGNSFRHLCQYLLTCDDSQVSGQRFPALQTGYLGPQPSFAAMGLAARSHSDPYIFTSEPQIEVAIETSGAMRVTSQLILPDTKQNLPDHVLVQTRGNTISFVTRFPQPGMYQLNLFALPASDRSENLPGVYNYLINCTSPRGNPMPFPKQYGQWKEGCYLYNPQDGDLSSLKGQAQLKFMLDVPKARQLAVVVGEEWFKLVQKAAESWEGEVALAEAWATEKSLAVCANFGGDMSSFSTLLEYSM